MKITQRQIRAITHLGITTLLCIGVIAGVFVLVGWKILLATCVVVIINSFSDSAARAFLREFFGDEDDKIMLSIKKMYEQPNKDLHDEDDNTPMGGAL